MAERVYAQVDNVAVLHRDMGGRCCCALGDSELDGERIDMAGPSRARHVSTSRRAVRVGHILMVNPIQA